VNVAPREWLKGEVWASTSPKQNLSAIPVPDAAVWNTTVCSTINICHSSCSSLPVSDSSMCFIARSLQHMHTCPALHSSHKNQRNTPSSLTHPLYPPPFTVCTQASTHTGACPAGRSPGCRCTSHTESSCCKLSSLTYVAQPKSGACVSQACGSGAEGCILLYFPRTQMCFSLFASTLKTTTAAFTVPLVLRACNFSAQVCVDRAVLCCAGSSCHRRSLPRSSTS
jgi:hypothetical protein